MFHQSSRIKIGTGEQEHTLQVDKIVTPSADLYDMLGKLDSWGALRRWSPGLRESGPNKTRVRRQTNDRSGRANAFLQDVICSKLATLQHCKLNLEGGSF
jgi:hypothetical protein